jgi:single-strand DNA-binding protein
MAGLNRCEFIGNLGADPDVRTTDHGNGDMVATFSVACNETWRDKATGEKREAVEWVRCVAWRGLAKVVAEYLHKGIKVYVSGKMQTRKYTDKDGVERYTTEISVRDMIMLDGKDGGSRPPHPADDFNAPPMGDEPPMDDGEDLPF